jgi:cysteine synthase
MITYTVIIELLDEVVQVTSADAIQMAKNLALKEVSYPVSTPLS